MFLHNNMQKVKIQKSVFFEDVRRVCLAGSNQKKSVAMRIANLPKTRIHKWYHTIPYPSGKDS